MALGGTGKPSTMSSTALPTGTFSLPEPVSTQGSTDSGGGGGGPQRGANYFFGFLITFVVLLLVFVACGVGSRRRFAARRQALFHGSLEPWGALRADVEQKRPTMYERQLVVVGEDKWGGVMPLSANLLLKNNLDNHDTSWDTLTHPAPAYPGVVHQPLHASEHIFSTFRLPSWSSSLKSKEAEASQHNLPQPDTPEAIQIAVMIVMPSRDRPPDYMRTEAAGQRLPEYQIGVACVSWEKDIAFVS
ncbi:hypothetical protein B0H34DRAFT_799065 [Crassisporium funariophilum]|nr:hypothetical protein B0H34DRAFT_799065 [Crassisporium funariophilum]